VIIQGNGSPGILIGVDQPGDGDEADHKTCMALQAKEKKQCATDHCFPLARHRLPGTGEEYGNAGEAGFAGATVSDISPGL
jgi:hypothetical protein